MMASQMQRANTPDPMTQRLLGIDNSIIDWHTNANNTVKDIYKNPTIGGMLPVFQMMKSNLDSGRVGRGVIGRTNLNNDQYSSDAALENDTNRSVAAGGALEMALQNQYGNAVQDAERLGQLDESRHNNALASMGSLFDVQKGLKTQISNSGWGGFFRGLAGGAVNLLSNPTVMAHI